MAEEVKAGAEALVISEEQLRKAEEYVQQEEGAANRLAGWVGTAVTGIAVAMTLFHLYAAYDIVPTQELRYIHVAFVLLLSFLLFPLAARFRNHVQWFDVIPALSGIAIIIYALSGGDDFLDRAAVPDRWDVILGSIFIVLVLEAARRTTGPIMPVVAIFSSPTQCSVRIYRRHGPIAASTSRAWSGICSSRLKEYSALQLMCRPR